MSRISRLIVSASLLLGSALAAPTQIPTSLLGSHYVTFDGNSFPSQTLIGAFPAGYGGAFQANIYNSSSAPLPGVNPQVRADVWCVDYQLDVSVGTSYAASIVRLASITTPTDPSVRYGNTNGSGAGSGAWVNTLTDLTASGWNTGSAAYRYTLAAALVSEYDNGSGVLAPETPDNDARNKAIQGAIWYITMNTDYNPSATWPGFDIKTDAPASNWVTWAEANVNTVDRTRWAVISGPETGNPLSLGGPDKGTVQTFLVQVLPEPTFYGLLMISMVGLFAAKRYARR